MEKGYVYIARIIDHGGKFVNGYHKIGLSKQYKVRETQLNSTHLPFDVLMVRVFESEDMRQLEGLLHVCFEDYRVVKEYDYRKNITTEWFDVTDIDVFNERVDKFIDLLGVNEIDMTESIDNDKTLTQEEKEETKNRVGIGRSVKYRLKIGNEWFKNEPQKYLMARAYKHICDIAGHDEVAKFDRLVSLERNNFKRYCEIVNVDDINTTKAIIDLNGSFLWTVVDGKAKQRHIEKLCQRFNINDVVFDIDSE